MCSSDLRHPWTGVAGGYALLSLAGVPGTPGMALWLDVARTLAAERHPGLLFAMALAWLAAFGVAADIVRRAFGVPDPAHTGDAALAPVSRSLRAAFWITAGTLVVLLWAWRAVQR